MKIILQRNKPEQKKVTKIPINEQQKK